MQALTCGCERYVFGYTWRLGVRWTVYACACERFTTERS